MFSAPLRAVSTGTRKVAWVQAALLPGAVLAGGWLGNTEAAWAAGYGVVVALAVTLVLVRREAQAMRHPEWDQHRLFKLFILTGVERLAVLVGLLMLGMAGLKLPPLPLLLGLVLAQAGWFAASGGARKQTGLPPAATK